MDGAEVLTHAADTLDKDLESSEASEAKLISAVKYWCGLTKDLLVGTEQDREQWRTTNPRLFGRVIFLSTYNRTPGFVNPLGGGNPNLAFVCLHQERVDMVADLRRKIEEAETGGGLEHEDAAPFVRSRCHGELKWSQ